MFPDGWGMVRGSNTQPVICLRFEARTVERLSAIKQEFYTILKEFIDPALLLHEMSQSESARCLFYHHNIFFSACNASLLSSQGMRISIVFIVLGITCNNSWSDLPDCVISSNSLNKA